MTVEPIADLDDLYRRVATHQTHLYNRLARALKQQETALSNIQSDVDAATAAITNAVGELGQLETAIADLKAANPTVDTSKLDTAVASLNTALAAATADNPPAATAA